MASMPSCAPSDALTPLPDAAPPETLAYLPRDFVDAARDHHVRVFLLDLGDNVRAVAMFPDDTAPIFVVNDTLADGNPAVREALRDLVGIWRTDTPHKALITA